MKRWTMSLLLLLTLVLGGAGMGVGSSAIQDRATWLWNPWMIVEDQSGTMAFLESKDINKVYLQIDRDISLDVYRSFIEAASAKGMSVYALDGAPDWVAPGGYVNQDRLLNWLGAYQSASADQEKFSGVHLDVEPYLYSGWNTKRGATVKSYQALVLRAKNMVDDLQLPLEVDMPFWFDEISYKNIYGKGLLAEWVIRTTDGVTIMAYRDSAPLIIDLARQEVEWAGAYSKSLVIGIETGETSEGDYISFYEEGESFMEQQLSDVTKYYQSIKGFNGTAIHHVGSWMTMKP